VDPQKLEHTHNPLAVFAQNPKNVYFDVQEKGEVIILLLRAHLITLVPTLAMIAILFSLSFFIPFILGILGLNLGESLNSNQSVLLIVSWYLFVFGFSFYKFIFWYFNVYLLTNERVVDFDFKGILHKETSYAPLTQIQDVSPKIVGFFGTIFHFGNVFIQTAGEVSEFEFHHVEKPDDVAKRILAEVRKEQGEVPGEIA